MVTLTLLYRGDGHILERSPSLTFPLSIWVTLEHHMLRYMPRSVRKACSVMPSKHSARGKAHNPQYRDKSEMTVFKVLTQKNASGKGSLLLPQKLIDPLSCSALSNSPCRLCVS